MEVTKTQLKRCDLVTVKGRVDGSTAPKLDQALKDITNAQRYRIVIDLGEVDYISSAGLRVIISAQKTCRRWNRGDVRLANLSERVSEVFNLAGLKPLFNIYESTVEAVGSF